MKYFITTFGCEANKADSERIARKLEMAGHKKAATNKQANLIVINACSVRQSAINRVYAQINKFKKKKIILAGCVLEKDKKKLKDKVNEIWHPDDYFSEFPIYSDRLIAYVPIMTGCNNFCTYCAVPYTRGRERSRPAKAIIKEVKKLIKNGFKEIWLLGQNVNSYKSEKINFPKLLKDINSIRGIFQIRFLSPHPKPSTVLRSGAGLAPNRSRASGTGDFSWDELIKVIKNCDKVVKYINLPAQSGDNEILQKMNRNYTREKYIKLINKIRRVVPGIKISTDVIVGFPGETKKQFENTVKLFKKIGFDKAYVAKYSPRPGTVAFKLKDNVSHQEKKRRWQILDKLANSPKRIIVVLGPTSSGKSALAVEIARKFNGEIISADSRQVYKNMPIGTGVVTKKEMGGIKHHLINFIDPKKIYSAIDFKNDAEKAIREILAKGKTPIICGGTGFYIHMLLGNIKIPEIEPDWELRKKLEKKSVKQLFAMLKKLDAKRAKNIDSKNKRRLIRAIEIAQSARSNLDSKLSRFDLNSYNVLYLGIKRDEKKLKLLIKKRIEKMLKQGLIKEVKKLRASGLTWKKIYELGFEYKYPALFIRRKMNREEMIERMFLENYRYAKRQMTWFKKYQPETKWLPSTTLRASKNKNEALKLTRKFLKS